MISTLKIRCQNILIVSLCFMFLSGYSSVIGQSSWYQKTAFCDGEWLMYKVKWGFIRLGTIEVFQQKTKANGQVTFKVKMCARSANLPFINVFFVNEGYLNPWKPTLQQFTLTSGKEATNITTYVYNPDSELIEMKTIDDGQVVRCDSLRYNDTIYDALGIFMSMRCLSRSGFNITFNNIVEFKIAQTHFNFSGQQAQLKIAAFREKKCAVKFSGKADWVGNSWAGVTGPFYGWISNDSCAVPLKVKVKIFLGYITLELADFKREMQSHN